MDFISDALRRVFKLALLVWFALLALSVLLVVLLAVGVHVLWSLVRGRKPALFTTFTRFRQASQQFSAGGWNRAGGFSGPRTEDIVDVQVHEVQDAVLPLPRSTPDQSSAR